MKGATIVVGLSYSPDGERAFESALAMATDLQGHLILVHALPRHFVPAGLSPGQADRLEEMEQNADMREALRLSTDFAERARKAGVEATPVVVGGDPVKGILQAVEDHDAHMIVVGTRRQGGFAKMLVGSIATAIVKRSRVPVLTIPLNP